jgi:uncharacterized protein RhaS with RHS repeats
VKYPDVTVGIAAEGGAQTSTVKYWYNNGGQLIKEIDEEGTETTYTYNPSTDPDNDGNAVLTEDQVNTGGGYLAEVVVDPGGLALSTKYTYDFLGNVLTEEDPEGFFDVYSINDWNEPYQVQRVGNDGNGNPDFNEVYEETKYWYDLNGNVVQMDLYNDNEDTQGDGYVSGWFEYDIVDQLRTETWEYENPLTPGADPNKVSFRHYDDNGNLTCYIMPNGTALSATYNTRNLVSTKTRHSNLSPGNGQLPPPNQSEDATVALTYDKNGNLTILEDGVGDIFEIAYDALDRRIALVQPNGTETVQELDWEGNITRVSVDGVFRTGSPETAALKDASYWYDEKNRLYRVEADWYTLAPDGSRVNCTSGAHVGFTQALIGYNARGDRTAVEDDAGNRTTYEYDAVGRVEFERYPEMAGFSGQSRNYVEFA